jgi:hypothetical protein
MMRAQTIHLPLTREGVALIIVASFVGAHVSSGVVSG